MCSEYGDLWHVFSLTLLVQAVYQDSPGFTGGDGLAEG